MKRRYIIMLALTFILTACATAQPIRAGSIKNRLSPCPKSPNCVSSLSEDKSHHVEPLTYKVSQAEAREKLIAVINSIERSEIVTAEMNYIHATFKTAVFRFVDDVEFFFDDERKVIDVRSASRKGYSDFGVNRKRVEEIRQRFIKYDG